MSGPAPGRRRTLVAVALLVFLAALLLSLLAGRRAGAQPPPAATVRGTVQDTLLRPIAMADVLVGDSVAARTDSAGRFLLERLPAGEVELTVRRLGYLPISIPVTLADGRTRTFAFRLTSAQPLMPVIVLARRPGIVGRVVDSAGAPIAGAEVTVAGAERSLTTNAEGVFDVPRLDGRTYFVQVRKPGYRAARFSIALPPDAGREVRVELWGLPDDLRGNARRRADGTNEVMAWALRDLDLRLRTNEPTMVPRAVLESLGRAPLCSVPLSELAYRARDLRAAAASTPEGERAAARGEGERARNLLFDWRCGVAAGACRVMLDNRQVDGLIAIHTPADLVESVEWGEDLTRTVDWQFNGIASIDRAPETRVLADAGRKRSDCRGYLVVWTRQ